MKKEWSKYQTEIFDTYMNKDCNIAVKAGPGSGKTTLLKQLCKLTPPTLKSIFLAFNKSITEELKLKLPSSVEVSTLHSLGCSALYSEYRMVKVNVYKTFGVCKKLENKWKDDIKDIKNTNAYFFNLCNLWDIYRMNLLTETGEEFIDLAFRYGLMVDETILKHFNDLVLAMNKTNSARRHPFIVDYVDMIYLPVAKKLDMKKYDRVFLDEAQDLNKCQHQLVEKLIKRGSKLVSVGDPYQSIYAFLGADAESFEYLSKRPNTETLPLSITYRCPRKVVDIVNTVFNVVEVAPGAEDGLVTEKGSWEDIEYGDMVLCRNNKPLLQLYLKLISVGKKCYIRGADIGKGLEKAIKPYIYFTIERCIEEMNKELDEIGNKLHLSGVKHPTKHPSYIKYMENIELVQILGQNHANTSELMESVKHIFKNDGEGIQLSSIHKSKGLEADRVFILDRSLIPSKYAQKDWELEQEQKLLFVAYSRAKKELVFISSGE